MHIETLIIGQGLAGTTLALQLQKRKKDYLIIDNAWSRSSSLVAAGLYNPVVFRKPSLSFNASVLVPYLKQFYAFWEAQWGVSFHQERNIVKLFSNIEEINNWEIKCQTQGLNQFLDPKLLPQNFTKILESPYGAGAAKQSGNVYLSTYLGEFKKQHSDNILEAELVEFKQNNSGWEVFTNQGKVTAERLILATGHLKQSSFRHLPLGDTKGDVLTIYCPEIKGMDIINKGFFIMPLGDGFHRVGATFEWDDKSYVPSQKAREELEGKLKGVLKCDYKVEDHQTGLRPTVGDRRPLLGEHPELKNLYIFNGLGSKGVMLAPYYSDQLVRHIFDQQELDKEVDIKRYKKHYGNS